MGEGGATAAYERYHAQDLERERAQAIVTEQAKWMQEQRKEEYRVAPLLEPLLKDVKVPEIGIAETLAQIEVKPLLSYVGVTPPPQTPIEFVKPKETVRPFAGIAAALITPSERVIYSIGRLAGLETPRLPPSIVSFSAQERAAAMAYGPEYAAGTVAGDILLSMGFGKVAGKIWEHTPKIIKAPVEKVAETVAKPFRPITSKLEEWLLWPHERIAPGIVSVPTPERVGLKGMEAQLAGWELAEAPKTSAYLISKMPSEPLAKAWATEHLLKTVTGGLSYALVSEQLRVMAVPAMPSHVPEVFKAGMTSAFVTQALGVSVAILPKAFAHEVPESTLGTMPKLEPAIKVKQPTFEEPFEIQKLKLFPQVYARERQEAKAIVTPQVVRATKMREELLSVPKLELSQIQRLKPVVVVGISTGVFAIPKLEEVAVATSKVEAVSIMGVTTTQETKQLQRQVQLQIQKQIPQFQIPKTMQIPKTWFEDSHKLKPYKPKAKDLFGLWGRYPRVYPLATPKQVLEMFTAKRRKRK